MSSYEIVFGVLCGALIAGMLIWIGVVLYMAYTQLDEVLGHLKNCSAVMARVPLRHAGPWGKLLLMGGISGIVTFPGVYLKHGGINTEDLKLFPSPLKRKFAILQWTGIGMIIILFLLWGIGQLVGWLS